MTNTLRIRAVSLLASVGCVAAFGVEAQSIAEERLNRPRLSFYGMPGLVEMPSGEMLPDAEVTGTVSYYPGKLRTALGFQITPWLYASYQYSVTDSLVNPDVTLYDRAFGIALRLWTEEAWRPSVAVGINDIAGTSRFASEYIVATKTLQDRFKLTAGIG